MGSFSLAGLRGLKMRRTVPLLPPSDHVITWYCIKLVAGCMRGIVFFLLSVCEVAEENVIP